MIGCPKSPNRGCSLITLWHNLCVSFTTSKDGLEKNCQNRETHSSLKTWRREKLPDPTTCLLFLASIYHPFNKAGQIPFQLTCVSRLYNWFGLICACVCTDVIKLCLEYNAMQWCMTHSDGSKYQYGAKKLHKIKRIHNCLMSSLWCVSRAPNWWDHPSSQMILSFANLQGLTTFCSECTMPLHR